MAIFGARRETVITLVLCYLGAILEGFDLQSMGLAGPQMIPELGLTKAQFGLAASLAPGGLLVGSIVGGRLADRIGRKLVLVYSVLLYGVFSFGTALVHSYESLLLMRILVGIGLGGAFPNLVALSAEAAGPERRSTMISIMYAGLPMGTVFGTSALLLIGDAFQWRWIFYAGGLAPLILAPLLFFFLPESAAFKQVAAEKAAGRLKRASLGEALTGGGRLPITLLLWISIFFTLFLITFLTNWLPQLMSSRGFSRPQSTAVLLMFGIGSIAGNLVLGFMSDSKARAFTGVVAYVGVVAALVGLSQLAQFPFVAACGFGVGFFGVGAYLVNLTLGPRFYPTRVRGTGVGMQVAASRLGSLSGPLLGGVLMDAGLSASMVFLAYAPGLVIAAVTVSLLLRKPAVADDAD